jgi:hypothetical protein
MPRLVKWRGMRRVAAVVAFLPLIVPLAAPASAQADDDLPVLVPGSVSPEVLTMGEEAIVTINISRPAPPGGTTVKLFTGGILYPPSYSTRRVIPEGQTSATVPIRPTTAHSEPYVLRLHAQASGVGQGVTQIAEVTLVPPDPEVQAIVAFETPQGVLGGSLVYPTVVLKAPAPEKGLFLSLVRNCAYTACVGGSGYIFVPEGSARGTVELQASDVTTPQVRTLYTALGTSVAYWEVTIVPDTLAIQGGTLSRGRTARRGVGIGSAPNPDGTTVQLSSDTPGVTVPETVTLEPGSPGAAYDLTISGDVRSDVAHVTATWNGQSVTDEVQIGGPIIDPEPTPPDTMIVSGPTGTVTANEATFEFASATGAATFECSLDGSPFASCTSPVTYGELALGGHTFRVRAIDGAGPDATPAERSWTVVREVAQPSVALTSPPEGAVVSGTVALAAEASADISGGVTVERVEFLVDGSIVASATVSPYIGQWDSTSRAGGSVAMHARVIDSAGNVAESAPRTITVDNVPPGDTTPPETVINSGPSGVVSVRERTATFTFSSPDSDVLAFECSLDRTPFADCSSPVTYDRITSGTHAFRVRAVDEAGNHDPTPETQNWVVGNHRSAR